MPKRRKKAQKPMIGVSKADKLRDARELDPSGTSLPLWANWKGKQAYF